MPKVGRNDPCPCGSGKKYKRCHGSPEWQESMTRGMREALARAEAQCAQRERQQGLGRPIVSAEVSGIALSL